MPRKPKNKRKNKKRRAFKSSMPMVLGGFPKKQKVKLRYVQELSLTAGVGAFATHVFRANSVFDPDYSGVGHQPLRFDNWASIYDHYTVLSSKMTLRNTGNGTISNSVPSYYGVMLNTDPVGTSGYTAITDVYENTNTTNPRIGGGIAIGGPTIPGASNVVTQGFSARSTFGLSKPQDGAAYGALVTTNPSKASYYHVYTASINGNNPGIVTFLVTIDYLVLFDQLVQGTQS